MEKLFFDRLKYGRELLIDTARVTEMDVPSDELSLSFYAILFLEAGSGYFELDTQRISLGNQQVIFIKPGASTKISQAVFQKGMLLFFERAFLDSFFNDQLFIYKFGFFHNHNTPYFLKLGSKAFERVYECMHEISDEIHNMDANSPHLLRALLYYLLIKLNREYSGHYQTFGKVITEQRILQFKYLLETQVRHLHRVQDYASTLKISRTHLNQLSQKYLGKTSREVIREHLLVESRKEVGYSKKDIGEIAYELGFSEPTHFIRFFKQMTTLTPLQFRRQFSNWS